MERPSYRADTIQQNMNPALKRLCQNENFAKFAGIRRVCSGAEFRGFRRAAAYPGLKAACASQLRRTCCPPASADGANRAVLVLSSVTPIPGVAAISQA
jgi:hypothetical protein